LRAEAQATLRFSRAEHGADYGGCDLMCSYRLQLWFLLQGLAVFLFAVGPGGFLNRAAMCAVCCVLPLLARALVVVFVLEGHVCSE
jgi:hypothetical protein